MKIEKISPDEIVLTYTKDDLDALGIDAENYFEDSRGLCLDLIDDADIEESFFDEESETVVEAVVTADGGLKINLRRVPVIFNVKKLKMEKESGNIFPLVYGFSDFETLLHSVFRIKDIFSGTGSLFKTEGKYFLVLNPASENTAFLTDMNLCEYGNKIFNSSFFDGKLKEYGDVLIKDTAVFDLSENFLDVRM